ncbi:MAG: 6-bladed beta-propeller [Bacteroidales bacterium]|nr:6-bladed beta-propeller [Bacteroidales bacterium]
MRKAILIAILMVVITACNKEAVSNLIVVDMEKSYPQKELVLQDFADVEYIQLENSDDFVTQGIVESIGKNFLLVTNGNGDGDIFVFDRKTGKGIRKINHKGQSGKEYIQMTEAVLDEENDEIFVVDYSGKKVLVYDLQGNFRRNFKFADESYYTYTYNYDKEHLLTFKSYLPEIENTQACHVLVSKKDGSIVHKFQSPYTQFATPVYKGVHEKYGEITVTPLFFLTVPSAEGWLLTRTSCDTIYNYAMESAIPFIVRTPSVYAMKTQAFLYPTALTERYIFMYTQQKELNMNTFKGFPTTELVYDRQEGSVCQCTVYNDDFTENTAVSFISKPISKDILVCQALKAEDLVNAYTEGILKGKLKEFAATLGEEDNPVIMLVKNREDKTAL